MTDVLPATVLAHGVGAGGLPLPRWVLAYLVAAAVGVVALALRQRPRPGAATPEAPDHGRAPVPPWAAVVGGVLGLGVWVLLGATGLFGNDAAAANLAPLGFVVVVWIGGMAASAVLGDGWRATSPFEAVARLTRRGEDGDDRVDDEARRRAAARTAAVSAPALVGAIVWVELAAPGGVTPRVVGGFVVAYSLAVAVLVRLRGGSWLRHGEGFAAVFGAFARLSPRRPGGLRHDLAPGAAAAVLVVVGALVFDGVTTLDTWIDLRPGALLDTLGLAACVAVVGTLALVAVRVASSRAGRPVGTVAAPALVPAAFGWVVCHSFALVAFEAQNVVRQASDPFGRGADLFGTAGLTTSLEPVSPVLVAWVQVGAITLGHTAALVVLHHRFAGFGPRRAAAARGPFVALVVASSVGAPALLLGA